MALGGFGWLMFISIVVMVVTSMVNSIFGLQFYARCKDGLQSKENQRRHTYLATITGMLAVLSLVVIGLFISFIGDRDRVVLPFRPKFSI